MAAILAITEQRDGALRKVSHEVVAAARKLAQGGGTVDALVFGAGPGSGTAELGADRVLRATHDGFRLYNPDGYAATIASFAAKYDVIVFAATATGRDLAPRIAARAKVGLATDVVELALEGGAV